MDVKKFIQSFFKVAESQKIRSNIIPIQNETEFLYNASVSKPYSFEIVNTGTVDMQTNGVTIVKGANANSMDTSLPFPRVGTFKRNDEIKLEGEGGGNMDGFIREDLELIG